MYEPGAHPRATSAPATAGLLIAHHFHTRPIKMRQKTILGESDDRWLFAHRREQIGNGEKDVGQNGVATIWDWTLKTADMWLKFATLWMAVRWGLSWRRRCCANGR